MTWFSRNSRSQKFKAKFSNLKIGDKLLTPNVSQGNSGVMDAVVAANLTLIHSSNPREIEGGLRVLINRTLNGMCTLSPSSFELICIQSMYATRCYQRWEPLRLFSCCSLIVM